MTLIPPEKLEEILQWHKNAKGVTIHGPTGAILAAYGLLSEGIPLLRAHIEAQAAEVERLKDVLHRDRSGLAKALNSARDAVNGWQWIANGEWGLYEEHEQTAETMRLEATTMINEVRDICTKALEESGNLAHAECCGRTPRKDPLDAALSRAETAEAHVQAARDVITKMGGFGAGEDAVETLGAIAISMRDERDTLRARVKELEGVVERLPKTADGVPMYIGMHIWFVSLRSGIVRDPEEYAVTSWVHYPKWNEYAINVVDEKGRDDGLKQDCCFATKDAARKAMENGVSS